MKYIIASIEGTRYDIAPEYRGTYGKVYHFRHYDLIIWRGGDFEAAEYEAAYAEISAHVAKVNAELANNRYYRGWCYAEMLTPNEQGQYNDIRCHLFHSWLVEKVLKGKVAVCKTNICGSDINKVFEDYKDFETKARIASAISDEMLKWISLPGDYNHDQSVKYNSIWDAELPIFELGYTLPYNIQLR